MNKRLNATIVLGAAVSGAFKSAIGQARAGIGSIGSSLSELKNRQRELNNVVKQNETLGRAGSALRVQYANQELAVINKQIASLKERERILARSAEGRANARSMMASGGLMIGSAVAAAATLGKPVKLAADFETAMAGVAKQVQGARDENGKLTATYFEMEEAIKQMGRETPIATNQIAGMVASAARMGVAKENLIDFTKVAVQMASAMDATDPADLAEKIGKIATLYKIPNAELVKLGDTINWLDDQALAKAPEIIEFMQRVGGVAGSVKIGTDQMAALGSTLLSLGETAQTAGTATNAIFQKFAAAEKGTKKFQAAMREIGLSTAAIQKSMQIDAQGTILKVLDAINKMPADKRLGIGVDLVGLEHSDTLAKLVSGVDEYRKQIQTAREGAGSMGREYEAQLATMNSQFKILGNTMTEVGVDLGTTLLPAMKDIVGSLKEASGAIADFSKEHPQLVGNVLKATGVVIGLTAALGVGKLAVGAIGYAWAGLPAVVTAAGTTFAWLAGTALPAVVTGIRAIGLALAANPIGLLVTGLATAAVLVYRNWDWVMEKVKAVGEYWKKAKAYFGFGDSPASGATSPAASPAAPSLPTPRGVGGNVTNNITNAPNITIHQQPGQDSKTLADDVARRLAEQQAVRRRGRLFDPAMGY